ncbi:radical SAM family heme chaperone HemW [Gephyromycinifex aptenodytis]|uniref:radical SAM family heme chaperone HemW n=1 Tax=Gephyromycinifex aptenodytis TaxID=2716227 RepID=UPI0014452E8B|nr:radical SAM family heme chaperone HemW [Gephyromycinifex aptenodytis]
MPTPPPQADVAPADGALPMSALSGFTRGGAFGVYIHVPFCRRRCGYCDFNTYTPAELGTPSLQATDGPVGAYLRALHAEIEMSTRVLPARPIDTVFFGGGTPTVLSAQAIGEVLQALENAYGFTPQLEVTTEANPDTVDESVLQRLREVGITRVSLGMQSSVTHVLATLDRTHDPAGVARAVAGAKQAGLVVSLDLIYGTPGETTQDWARSLDTAIDLGPDHISAYALVVEEGTRLAGQVRRGQVAPPQDDDEADKYELAAARLESAGFSWYEVSNWSHSQAGTCRHNLGYWRDGHWWGFGPGAHSHVGGVRWWNVRHPSSYADRLGTGLSPAQAREILSPDERYDECVLLRSRLAEGLPLVLLRPHGRAQVDSLVGAGLCTVVPEAPNGVWGANTAEAGERLILTVRGRLLADTVVRQLLV